MSWVWCLQFFSRSCFCNLLILLLQTPNFLSNITLRWYGINNLLYWVKWIKCTWAPRCFMHQVNLWNTMWAWWLYLPVELDIPYVKSCIMFFSFICLHNFMKLFLNKWQCLGCDACQFFSRSCFCNHLILLQSCFCNHQIFCLPLTLM